MWQEIFKVLSTCVASDFFFFLYFFALFIDKKKKERLKLLNDQSIYQS